MMSVDEKQLNAVIDRLTNIAMANRMALRAILHGIGTIDLPVRDAILDQLRGEMDDAEEAGVWQVADGLRDFLQQM